MLRPKLTLSDVPGSSVAIS